MTQALTDRSRSLLKAMGIDVYLLRECSRAIPQGHAPGDVVAVKRGLEASSDGAREVQEPSLPASNPTRPASAPKAVLPPATRSGNAAAPGSRTAPVQGAVPTPRTAPAEGGSAEAASAAAAGPAVSAFTVFCLRKAGGLVIMTGDAAGGPRQKAERRFAVDLLAAATGAWGGNTEAVTFAWPQAGIDNTAMAQQKALGAFLAKQLGDAQGSLVLMDEGLADRLPAGGDLEGYGDVFPVPPLAALMSDGALKRRLWQALARHGAE